MNYVFIKNYFSNLVLICLVRGMRKRLLLSFFISIFLVLNGCVEQDSNETENGSNETSDNGADSDNGTDDSGIEDGSEFSDPCGNAIGNGNEIISGPSEPEHEADRDNPFRSLTVHPTNPDVIIVGTERNGFVKSIDGGNNWTRSRKGLRHYYDSYPEIYDIAFSENNPDIVYAAVLDGPGPVTGNYPSSNGGIYKSLDGGETWQRKNCGIDNGWIWSVYINPNDPNNAIIGISGGETTFTGWDISGQYFDGGIYKTTDGGDNWHRVNVGEFDNVNSYMIIKSAKNNSSLLYTFGSNFENLSENVGFLKSIDDGETWYSFASDLRNHQISYFDISSNGNVIYAVDTHYIHKSIDGGETWNQYNVFSGGYVLAVFPNSYDRIIYSTIDGVFLSKDGLESNTKVISIDQGQNHVSDIVIAPSDSNIVYVVTVGYDFYKSTDAGESFTKIVNLRNEVLNVIP